MRRTAHPQGRLTDNLDQVRDGESVREKLLEIPQTRQGISKFGAEWKIYRVVTDDDAQAHGQLRVVDESGEGYVYPARYFHVIHLPPALKARYPSAASGRDTD